MFISELFPNDLEEAKKLRKKEEPVQWLPVDTVERPAGTRYSPKNKYIGNPDYNTRNDSKIKTEEISATKQRHYPFNLKLENILKGRGYNGPVRLKQLGQNWVETLKYELDSDDLIMVKGNDSDSDAWVGYSSIYLRYAFGQERGYMTGNAARAERETRELSVNNESSPPPMKDMIAVSGAGEEIKPGDTIRTKKMQMTGKVEKITPDKFNENSDKVFFRVADGRLMQTAKRNCVKTNSESINELTDGYPD